MVNYRIKFPEQTNYEMKTKMPYDDYVMGETQLNCDNQNVPVGFGVYIWAYKERVLHELKLLNKPITK